jgi:hypothetical protein
VKQRPIFGNAADKCGTNLNWFCFLFFLLHNHKIVNFYFVRCICPSLTDRKKRISKSYRTCRSNNNSNNNNGSQKSNCCTGDARNSNSPEIGDAIGNEQRHTGRRGSDELRSGTESNVNSRARPLYIPSNEWQGHNHESHHESKGLTVEIHQPKRQQERPTELLLSTEQFQNGHSHTQSKTNNKSTYMEQFWICAKRFAHCMRCNWRKCGSNNIFPVFLVEEKALSDLERLARREKIYCMTLQHQNSDSDSSSQTIVPNRKNKL